MKKNPHIESFKRLQHIDQAIEGIEKYVMNESEQSFSTNLLVQSAVFFQFTVIGEAIQHIEDEILGKYDYPWFKVRSFRNLIAHEYFNLKMSAVWQIIKKDLPGLRELILKIIDNEFASN
jgi:uncharacterized protein with HEPN domain